MPKDRCKTVSCLITLSHALIFTQEKLGNHHFESLSKSEKKIGSDVPMHNLGTTWPSFHHVTRLDQRPIGL